MRIYWKPKRAGAKGPKCEGCRVVLDPIVAAWGAPYVCMSCVEARHRGAVNQRCTCSARLKRPRRVVTRSRSWVACDRCLAPIVAKNPRKTTKRRSKMRIL